MQVNVQITTSSVYYILYLDLLTGCEQQQPLTALTAVEDKPLLLALSSIHKRPNALIYLVEIESAMLPTSASNFHSTLDLLQLYRTLARFGGFLRAVFHFWNPF